MLELDRELKIDLALSGGGVRASFYSLGVTLYLADSRLIERVSTISSVSGGSITNAVLAAGGDDIAKNPAIVHDLVKRTASHLARDGLFFGDRTLRSTLKVASILFVSLPVAYTVGSILHPRPSYDKLFFILSWLSFLSIPMVVLLMRKRWQLWLYERLLSRVAPGLNGSVAKGKRVAKTLGGGKRLSDMPKSSIVHIFCSTELTSGTPFFLTRDWAHCPAWGWASFKNMTVAEAIYASAAFPLVFPPLEIKGSSLF